VRKQRARRPHRLFTTCTAPRRHMQFYHYPNTSKATLVWLSTTTPPHTPRFTSASHHVHQVPTDLRLRPLQDRLHDAMSARARYWPQSSSRPRLRQRAVPLQLSSVVARTPQSTVRPSSLIIRVSAVTHCSPFRLARPTLTSRTSARISRPQPYVANTSLPSISVYRQSTRRAVHHRTELLPVPLPPSPPEVELALH
jgi:hypothetical protein